MDVDPDAIRLPNSPNLVRVRDLDLLVLGHLLVALDLNLVVGWSRSNRV